MPYVWVEPEVVMDHAGVTIYHIDADDYRDGGARAYWYGTRPGCADNGSGEGANSTCATCRGRRVRATTTRTAGARSSAPPSTAGS